MLYDSIQVLYMCTYMSIVIYMGSKQSAAFPNEFLWASISDTRNPST